MIISADRGLCGGYNTGVQRAAEGEIKVDVLGGLGYELVTVGRKADNYFRFRGYNRNANFAGFSIKPVTGKFAVVLPGLTNAVASAMVTKINAAGLGPSRVKQLL